MRLAHIMMGAAASAVVQSRESVLARAGGSQAVQASTRERGERAEEEPAKVNGGGTTRLSR